MGEDSYSESIAIMNFLGRKYGYYPTVTDDSKAGKLNKLKAFYIDSNVQMNFEITERIWQVE
jgi:glutathione S-transferase